MRYELRLKKKLSTEHRPSNDTVRKSVATIRRNLMSFVIILGFFLESIPILTFREKKWAVALTLLRSADFS